MQILNNHCQNAFKRPTPIHISSVDVRVSAVSVSLNFINTITVKKLFPSFIDKTQHLILLFWYLDILNSSVYVLLTFIIALASSAPSAAILFVDGLPQRSWGCNHGLELTKNQWRDLLMELLIKSVALHPFNAHLS